MPPDKYASATYNSVSQENACCLQTLLFIYFLAALYVFVCFFHHASQPFFHYPAVNLTYQATPLCSVYRGISAI